MITLADGEIETFDAIVNCGYANASRIAAMLGHASPTQQCEYLAVPLVELDEERRQDSFTLLDGPFFSILPFGNSGHLLNHVDHSVIARDYAPVLDAAWLDPETAPFAALDRERTFETIIAACVDYMPELRRARLKGFVEASRMVLAGVDDTDARPTIVERRDPAMSRSSRARWIIASGSARKSRLSSLRADRPCPPLAPASFFRPATGPTSSAMRSARSCGRPTRISNF